MSEHLTTTSEGVEKIMPHKVIKVWVPIILALILSLCAYKLLSFSDATNKGIALLIFIGILWLTEAIHITVTALLVPLTAVLLQLPSSTAADAKPMTIKNALSGFSDPIIFVFLGGFALAAALHVQKIDRKLTNAIIQMSGSSMFRAVIALITVTALLSMWISNTATAVMILPLAISIMDNLDKDDRNTRVFILLCIAYAASIGGMGTLVGSPPNGIAARELGWKFTEWLSVGLPVMIVLMPLMVIAMFYLFKPKLGTINISHFNEDIPWTPKRVLTVVVFITTALLWIFSDQLKKYGASDSSIALLAIVLVGTLGLAQWHEISKNTDWGVLLLFGGGISLSTILSNTGASKAIGDYIAMTFQESSVFVVIFVVATFIIFLTELTSNTASAALLVPVFGSIGVQMGLPKEVLALVIGLGASCAFMLPVATPPNAVVFATGLVRQRDMMKAGFVLNIISIIVVTGFAHFIWR